MTTAENQSEQNAKRILIVDDEPDIRESLADFLSSEGYQVQEAGNGKDAIAAIEAAQFDVVVSDVRMPEMNGVEMLAWILKNRPKIRTILMTGFADIKETLDASALGVRGFLMKPFKLEELLKCIEESLKPLNLAFTEFEDNKYMSVRIEDFHTPPNHKYKLFIKLLDGRFLKIAEVGDYIPKEKLLYLKAKGIHELWLEMDDFKKYNAANQVIAKGVLEAKNIPVEKKLGVIRHATELATENLKVIGINKDTVSDVVAVLETSLDSILRVESSTEVLKMIENASDTLYSHCATCGILSGLVAKVIGWSSKKSIQILVLGGFLHDIGLFQMPPHLMKTPMIKMNKDELKQYQEHPLVGYQLVKDLSALPKEVSMIVLQHHENPKGTGFPQGLLRSDIFPMTRIVTLIDIYLEAIEKLPMGERKKSAIPTLEKIIKRDPMNYDNRDILALQLAISEPDLKKAQMKLEREMGAQS